MMSTGLACDQVGGNDRVQAFRSSPAKAPPVRPAVDELIDRQHARSAAIGDDGDATRVRAARTAPVISAASNSSASPSTRSMPARPQRRLDDPIGARQRAGMRRGRLRRLLRGGPT